MTRIAVKMNRKAFVRYFLLVILLLAVGNSTWAENVSREAQKHMNRGIAVEKMATLPADYEEAVLTGADVNAKDNDGKVKNDLYDFNI